MHRFAFYGRVSTEDQQDPASSRLWQLRRAQQLIQPVGGTVVDEFFDIGLSRSVPWKRRPAATALMETFKNPRRGFDAVVIGDVDDPSTLQQMRAYVSDLREVPGVLPTRSGVDVRHDHG